MLLVAVDAHSKWPEVHVVSSTSTQHTIDKLRSIFACYGLPATLISDNGSLFQSTEFQQFVTANGIIHRRVPPHHPSSNGLVENRVVHCTFPGHILQHSAYHNISNTSRTAPQLCTADSPFLNAPLYVNNWSKLLRCRWVTNSLKHLLSMTMS